MKSVKKYHLDNNFLENPKEYRGIYLVQVGRLFCGEVKTIQEHYHNNWFELTIVNKGETTVFTNGVSTTVKAGEIFLSFPNETHEMISKNDAPFEFDFFSFYTKDTEFSVEFDRIKRECKNPKNRIFTSETIKSLVINLMGEFLDNDLSMSNRIVGGILEQILIYIIRSFSEKGKDHEYVNVSNHDIFCYHVMDYIDNNIYGISDLKSLEKIFNYNYSYISDLFSETTGQTLSSYFKNKRMSVAKSLIKENKLSVEEIAEKLNYSSVFSFSKAFKEKFGVSQKNYYKQTL
jgi:AraC-like DNA-binding protein